MSDEFEASSWDALPEAIASRIFSGESVPSLASARLACSAWRSAFTSSCSSIKVNVPVDAALVAPVKHLNASNVRLSLPIFPHDEDDSWDMAKLVNSIHMTLRALLTSSLVTSLDLSFVMAKDSRSLKLASTINILPEIRRIQESLECAPLTNLTLLHDLLSAPKAQKLSFMTDLATYTSLSSLTLYLKGSFTEDFSGAISQLPSLTRLDVLCISDSMAGLKTLRTLQSASLIALNLEPSITNPSPDVVGILGLGLPNLKHLQVNINRSPVGQVFSSKESRSDSAICHLTGLTSLSFNLRGFSDALVARSMMEILYDSPEPQLLDLTLILLDDRRYNNVAPMHPWDAGGLGGLGDLAPAVALLDLDRRSNERAKIDPRIFWDRVAASASKIKSLCIRDERRNSISPIDVPLDFDAQDQPFGSISSSSDPTSAKLPLMFSNQYRPLSNLDPATSSQLDQMNSHPWCLGALVGCVLSSASSSLTDLDLKLPSVLGHCLFSSDLSFLGRHCPLVQKLRIDATFPPDARGDLGLLTLPLKSLSLSSLNRPGPSTSEELSGVPLVPLDLSLLPRSLEGLKLVGFHLRTQSRTRSWHALQFLDLRRCRGDVAFNFESARVLSHLKLISNGLSNFFKSPRKASKSSQCLILSHLYPKLERLSVDDLFAPYRLFQELRGLRSLESFSVCLAFTPPSGTKKISINRSILLPLIHCLSYGLTEVRITIQAKGQNNLKHLLHDDSSLLSLPTRCPHLKMLEVVFTNGEERFLLPLEGSLTRTTLQRDLPHTLIC